MWSIDLVRVKKMYSEMMCILEAVKLYQIILIMSM